MYPITVYSSLSRTLFAYGLGFAFVAHHPALTLLNRADPLRVARLDGLGCTRRGHPCRNGGRRQLAAGHAALPEYGVLT